LIGDSSTVSIQDKVTILGYPWTSDVGQNNPLNPTVTTGSISGKVMIGGTQALQIQGDARQGHSGGPVLDKDGTVIGIISWGTDYANFYLRPSNDIKALLGVENKLGQVDELWRKGLIMFNNSHYSESINYFDSILNLSSGHLLSQEYKAKAQSNMGNDVPYIYPGETVVEEEKPVVETVEETPVEEPVIVEVAEEDEGLDTLTLIMVIVFPIIFVILIVLVIVLFIRRKGVPPQPAEESPASKKTKTKGKYCSSCGTKIESGQAFCSNCGKKV
jgi:hypothetical protein